MLRQYGIGAALPKCHGRSANDSRAPGASPKARRRKRSFNESTAPICRKQSQSETSCSSYVRRKEKAREDHIVLASHPVFPEHPSTGVEMEAACGSPGESRTPVCPGRPLTRRGGDSTTMHWPASSRAQPLRDSEDAGIRQPEANRGRQGKGAPCPGKS